LAVGRVAERWSVEIGHPDLNQTQSQFALAFTMGLRSFLGRAGTGHLDGGVVTRSLLSAVQNTNKCVGGND
jgi:hypothetical protein